MDIATINIYASKVKKLDKILNELTRDFCADHCPRDNDGTGCCSDNCYNQNIPVEMLEMQKEEALKNKWVEDKTKRVPGKIYECRCKYHSSTGCKLTNFKPPICIGYLCTELRDYLEGQDYRIGSKFTESMDNISSGSLNSQYQIERLFRLLDEAILSGNHLIRGKRVKVTAEKEVVA